jgi:antitoxin component of RelBE/YafQ-DinJ toxin-antitoxin module
MFRGKFVNLQARKQRTAIMEVVIDSKIYQQASTYAQQQGLNLTSVIENFLVRFVGREKDPTEQAIPDVVLSLLGAGEKVAEDDLNAREAYYEYLEEKYK